MQSYICVCTPTHISSSYHLSKALYMSRLTKLTITILTNPRCLTPTPTLTSSPRCLCISLSLKRGRWHIWLCLCEEELRWKKEIGAVFHLVVYQLRHVVPRVATITALCTVKSKQPSMQKLECPRCICTVMSSSTPPLHFNFISMIVPLSWDLGT